MSTLRVSNIEAKADVSSPTVDEKIKFTNSSGDVLFHLDGKTSGITTVGINTTGNTFTVNNTTGDVSFSGSVTSSGVSTFTSDVSIADKIVHIGDTNTAIRFPAADTITAETGGSERLRIDSSGRLIVGVNGATSTICSAIFQGRSDGATNSAVIRLAKGSSTPGTTDSLGIIQFSDNGTKHAAQIQAQRDGGTWTSGTQTPASLLFFTSPDSATGATERLRITSDGIVQVGSSHSTGSYGWDPTFKVAVEQGGGDPSAIHFGESVNGSANPAINFLRRDGGTLWSAYAGQISYEINKFQFKTAPNTAPGSHSFSTRMTILQGGNVGIGTDNPGYKLDIRPTASDPTSGSPPAGAFLQIRADDPTVGYGPSLVLSNFGGSKETAWRISAVSTSGNNGDLVFHGYAGGATYPEAARFTSAGNLKFPSGQGIDFSASADGSGVSIQSEILDDYEEGGWTPSIDGLSNSPSYSNLTGRYTRIGRMVVLKMLIQPSTNPTFSNTSSTFLVSGIPFTTGNNNAAYYSAQGSVRTHSLDFTSSSNNNTSATASWLTAGISGSKVVLIANVNNTSWGEIRNNMFHNKPWILELQMTYFTDQ